MQLDTCDLPFADLTLTQSSVLNTIENEPGTLSPAPEGSVLIQDFETLGEKVRAIVVRNLVLADGVQLEATGDLPLAIVASGRVTLGLGAGINVSAGRAGARLACSDPAMVGATNTAGGGGGGGGGYGGAGGDGDAGGQGAAPGGQRSNSIGVQPGPFGGCPGAAGGAGSAAGAGGVGGPGGGALYIVAKEAIDLGNGVINASGGGGEGGEGGDDQGGRGGGGGGGGAGGMILLEAPSVLGVGATIVANGGGGGEGGDDASGGRDGQDGQPSPTRALGGSGGSSGGAGGAGGAGTSAAGETMNINSSGGGGGGGGGVGYIRIVAPVGGTVGIISPPPQ
jgi:hypothetical protein